MKRRQFNQLLTASASWPLAARAQGNPEAPKIGFVYQGTKQLVPSRLDALTSGVRASGYPSPQIEIVTRVADGDPAKIAPLVAEVLARKVSVFVATGPVVLHAARDITKTVPIVTINFEEDPIVAGYAQSIAHPGGNVTGIFLDFPDFSGKWIELLREFLPQLSRIALIWDANTGRVQVDAVMKTVAALNIRCDLLEVKRRSDYIGAFAIAKDRGAEAGIIASSPLVTASAKQLSDLSLHHRLPAITMFSEFPRTGGLISYGPNLQQGNKQVGVLVGKVLAGAAPANLPIERPSMFELIVNARAAEALGLTIPALVQARADEVIG